MRTQISTSVSEETLRQFEELRERMGASGSEVLARAIDRMHREGAMDDRTAQIGWLRTLAGDLTSNNWEGTPEEIVAFWEQEERRIEGDEAFPEWYDDHDREILTRFGARPFPGPRRSMIGDTAGFAVEVIVGSAASLVVSST